MKNYISICMVLCGSVSILAIDLVKPLENKIVMAVVNKDFYVTTFKGLEQQKKDLVEIFKQGDVQQFCGVSNSTFFLQHDFKKILIVCSKQNHKVCGVLIYGYNDCLMYGQVNILAIHKDYRKLGLAQMLLQEVEKIYVQQKKQAMLLCVYDNNIKALALYKKYGFVPYTVA